MKDEGSQAGDIEASRADGMGRLNALSAGEAAPLFENVCGSKQWIAAMLEGRPFASAAAMHVRAERAWFGLSKDDWMEAFSHHPRIGERNLNQAQFVATASQSSREQSGMAAASEEQRREFAAGNEAYEERFGHVFLICATGKSVAEMLEQLRVRLGNTREAELKNATEAQAKIIRLRLETWLTT